MTLACTCHGSGPSRLGRDSDSTLIGTASHGGVPEPIRREAGGHLDRDGPGTVAESCFTVNQFQRLKS